MKTTCRLLALLVGLCVYQKTRAQDFSQDWANYTQFLDQSDRIQAGAGVNEFTGAVSYSFNFYTLNSSGQNFPVSIGYYSNGIKVDEYASCVGLGWTLNAGGSITKVTRGLDDQDATKGYQNTSTQSRTLNNVYTGVIDGEKDYYTFSAFGLSGTFYYDEATASYKPMAGEKITIEWQASPGIFIIRDEAGNTYHFTSRETINTYSESMSNLVNTQYGNWFLTRVVLADKKEVLLTYEAKTITGLKVAFSEIARKWHGCPGQPGHEGRFIYNSYSSFRIKSISTAAAAVNFIYNTTARQDITDDYALDKVEIQENGTLLKRYVLKQDYHSNRLMLNKITDKNVITGEEQHLVSLEYYKDYTMPAPVSVQSQDVLGFFNNQLAFTSTVLFPNGKSLVAPYQDPLNTSIVDGANREIAAASVVQTLLLKKITTLYGKVEEYEYESNKYGQEIQVMGNPPTNAEFTSYGVRVNKVTSYELTQPNKKKYIGYIYKDNDISTGVKVTHIAATLIQMYSDVPDCYGRIRMPNARKTRPQAVDAPVVYKKVKTQVYTDPANISTSTLGYTINTYSIDSPGFIDETWGGNSDRVFYTTRFQWGQPVTSGSYNKNMELVSQTTYTYESAITKKYLGAFVWLGAKLVGGVNDATGVRYYTSIGYKRLKSISRQAYNTDAQLISTTKKVLDYDSRGYVSEAKAYVNNVLVGRTTYKRPYNYTLSGTLTDASGIAVREMNAQNIAAPVIESISYKVAGSTETVMDASISLYKYDFLWNIILPDKTLSYKQVSPQATVTALTFNTSGVPSYPSSYMLASQTSMFDDKHNPVEIITNGVAYTAMHFNDQGDLLCTFSPSPYNSAAFLGFEPYEISRASTYQMVNSNWLIASGYEAASISANSFSGTAGIDLSAGPTALLTFRQQLDLDKRYVVRYWQKEGSGYVKVFLDNSPVNDGIEIKKENGWVLVEHEVTSGYQLTIEGSATIDDLLLYPLGAGYQYQVFNARGLKTAEADASGNTLFYEYDQFDRTTQIKNSEGYVLKAFEYGIQEKQ